MLLDHGWEDLENVVRAYAQSAHNLKYITNLGNAGDALIAAGAFQFFDDLAIRPQVTWRYGVRRGDIAIYAGGGNLVPEYHNCAKFLRRCLSVGVHAALVLPQTVRGHEELLQELDARFTIVCRDAASFARVRKTGTRANVLQAPDMALRLTVEKLVADCARPQSLLKLGAALLRYGNAAKYYRWRKHLTQLAREPRHTMHIIRTDVESVATLRGDPRWDVSNYYVSKFRTRSEADFVARDYLLFVARAEKLVTNRLHAGIAGALTGREVQLLDNSYGKIRAIYETSLMGLPKIQFVTNVDSL